MPALQIGLAGNDFMLCKAECPFACKVFKRCHVKRTGAKCNVSETSNNHFAMLAKKIFPVVDVMDVVENMDKNFYD